MRASLINPVFGQSKIVVPESDNILEKFRGAKDGLYLLGQIGGYSMLRHLKSAGKLTNVDLPCEGSILCSTSPHLQGLWLDAESWLAPPRTYQLKSANQPLQHIPLGEECKLDLSAYQVVRMSAVARDGTAIPLSVVCRKDIRLNGTNPTLVEAYGSYQTSLSPFFLMGAI